MESLNANSRIEPLQLTKKSRFKFLCDKSNKCFTNCCRGTDIVLTPYDVIRLKKRFELPSEEFLAIYTNLQIWQKTDLPVPTLKLLDDEEKSCPFVKDYGCLIYEDRPAACRYYPIGMANMRPKEGDASEEFFFFVKEDHCDGFECDKEWTVDEWRHDQGVIEYDKFNSSWADLVVRKRSFPSNIKLTKNAKRMYFMATYDLDQFRRFILESRFLETEKVDAKTLAEIKNDDVALLNFGVDWLKRVLFKGQELAQRVKESAQAELQKNSKTK